MLIDWRADAMRWCWAVTYILLTNLRAVIRPSSLSSSVAAATHCGCMLYCLAHFATAWASVCVISPRLFSPFPVGLMNCWQSNSLVLASVLISAIAFAPLSGQYLVMKYLRQHVASVRWFERLLVF